MKSSFLNRAVILLGLQLVPALCCHGAEDNSELPPPVRPAPIFGSRMVLQQDAPIRIWGEAAAGQRVEVVLGADSRITAADSQGNWSITLPARKASSRPLALQINNLRFEDILIGEVWICSGQSNMAFALKDMKGSESVLEKAAVADLRLANYEAAAGGTGGPWSEEVLARCNVRNYFRVKWSPSDRKTAGLSSAVAWLLGQGLQQQLAVPVGIITVAVGGSAMNNWISPDDLKRNPVTASLFERDWLTNKDVRVQHRERAQKAFRNVLKAGEPYIVGKMPYRWVCEPGFLFEAGIAPLKSLSFRGVLWYQGESDVGDEAALARSREYWPMLVTSWRRYFGRDFPFLYVQLPAFKEATWPQFRELQRDLEKRLPNMAMIVTVDTGEETNIHPANKEPIGRRAVRMALKHAYGMEGILGFPHVEKIRVEGGTLVLEFSECGEGFLPVEGAVPGFEVADRSGVFHPAYAQLSPDSTITISAPVKEPGAVRYGWQPFPNPPLKLFNSERLPLGPFQVLIRQ